MKALVFNGPGQKSLVDCPMPVIKESTDVIVKMEKSTICGTDLHILKGDVPAVTPGRILGHEGMGIVESKKLQPEKLVSHRFDYSDMMNAYEVFANAAKEKALKVIINFN